MSALAAAADLPQPAYPTNVYFTDQVTAADHAIQPGTVINVLPANQAQPLGYLVIDLIMQSGHHQLAAEIVDHQGKSHGDLVFDPIQANRDPFVYTAVGILAGPFPPGRLYFKISDQLDDQPPRAIGALSILVQKIATQPVPFSFDPLPYSLEGVRSTTGEDSPKHTPPTTRATPSPPAVLPTPPSPPAVVGSPEAASATHASETPIASPLSPEVEAARAVDGWAAAWSAREVDAYLSYYSEEFKPPAPLTRQQWEEQRGQRLRSAQSIQVTLSDPHLTITPDGVAIATFMQDYRSDLAQQRETKRLRLKREAGRWKIIAEQILLSR